MQVYCINKTRSFVFMPFASHPSFPRVKPRAFTLVEVLLAMTLAGTTLLALVSLLSTALETVREAGQITITSQIARNLSARLQQMSWQVSLTGESVTPPGWNEEVRRFDPQGSELTSGRDDLTAYAALVTLEPLGTILPGGQVNPFSCSLRVEVAEGPARPRSWFQGRQNQSRIATLRTVITSRAPVLEPLP